MLFNHLICNHTLSLEMHWLQISWPIPIFFLRTIIDSIYKQKSMQISTKNYLHNTFFLIKKIQFQNTIPPIWTNLQIFSNLNNSQNKVLSDWKEEEIINLKWVPVCNKTDVIFPLFINGHFFPLTLLNVSSFTSNSYFVSINSIRITRNCRVVTKNAMILLNLIKPPVGGSRCLF